MTTHMDAYIITMISTVKTMQTNAQLTAMNHGGGIDKDEQRILDQLDKACGKFIKELQKIK